MNLIPSKRMTGINGAERRRQWRSFSGACRVVLSARLALLPRLLRSPSSAPLCSQSSLSFIKTHKVASLSSPLIGAHFRLWEKVLQGLSTGARQQRKSHSSATGEFANADTRGNALFNTRKQMQRLACFPPVELMLTQGTQRGRVQI